MITLPKIDTDFMVQFLTELLNTPSPTGFTDSAVGYTERIVKEFPPIELARTRKGGLVATIPGKKSDSPRGLTAHVDTLGA